MKKLVLSLLLFLGIYFIGGCGNAKTGEAEKALEAVLVKFGDSYETVKKEDFDYEVYSIDKTNYAVKLNYYYNNKDFESMYNYNLATKKTSDLSAPEKEKKLEEIYGTKPILKHETTAKKKQVMEKQAKNISEKKEKTIVADNTNTSMKENYESLLKKINDEGVFYGNGEELVITDSFSILSCDQFSNTYGFSYVYYINEGVLYNNGQNFIFTYYVDGNSQKIKDLIGNDPKVKTWKNEELKKLSSEK